MALKFSFVSNTGYFDLLCKRLDKSKKHSRVLLMTMDFNPTEPEIARVSKSLVAASKRGVDVTFGVDAHSFMHQEGKFGPLWYHRELPDMLKGVYAAQQKVLETLNYAPLSRAYILNKPLHSYSMHVAGRSHIKLALFNDEIIIPCANLSEQDYTNLAIVFRNRAAADWLYGNLRPAMTAHSVSKMFADEDLEYPVDEHTRVLVDAGKRGQSSILDEALALIDSAEKWLTITCQYFPGGQTAKHLLAAKKRGVDVRILFSPPTSHKGFVKFGNYANVALAKLRYPKGMFEGMLGPDEPRMHAKLIACDKGLMIGSHNYVSQGVMLGTAEIALKVADGKVAKEAVLQLEK